MLKSKTQHEWRNYMQDNGDRLAKAHLSSKKSSVAWTYFKSNKYEVESRHLKDFLVEYARDSGNILASE